MSRKFTDAKLLLEDLLDRHEAGAASPIAYPDYSGFASVTDMDAFIRQLRFAEDNGAVRFAMGRGNRREQVAYVRLESADALYRHLERTPIMGIARDAYSRIVEGLHLHERLGAAANDIVSIWTRAKTWNGLAPRDAERVRNVFLLAQAILDGQHAGMDYRTFSRRIVGDSKTLERLEGPVVRLLSGILDLPPGAKPREALRTLGLEKFAPPLLVSGHVDLDEADLSRTSLMYIGIPPKEAERIRFRQTPAYLLTIENYASFNRHIAEADPTRMGTTIYVGGYPSLGTQKALQVIVSKLPKDVPLFHWSDIDADGTWIFRTIENAIGRSLRPHLMSPEIAHRLGKTADGRSIIGACSPTSGIIDVVRYLAQNDAKTLEQEELDPELPFCPGGAKSNHQPADQLTRRTEHGHSRCNDLEAVGTGRALPGGRQLS
jgi:hypothetical protein